MSTPILNRRIVLASRPSAAATLGDFRLEDAPVPEPGAGEVLTRTLWLSLDPYMRGRMSDAPSYAPPVEVGAPMVGGTVARIESSRHPDFKPGELVLAYGGWQEYAVAAAASLVKLPASMAQPSHALGVLGMPGFTAYMGLLDIGKPRAGETVVVAAATGAVGSLVGQIAKLNGCRVVGIAGGAQKCRWAVDGLGFDACVDHRAAGLAERLAEACGSGIDVYFENVGGQVLRAVLPLLNVHARMPVCGLISHYQGETASLGADFAAALLRTVLVKRVTMRGFIIFDDYGPRFGEFQERMSAWLREGAIKYREDVVDGLEKAPAAFLGLMTGGNFGKLVVRVAD
ncbi:MAG: NADP-dependent oxidoreductase [Steroidobacteraceae bacterium]|nr:NADP-dependent oxidoreductase [Steroidobacteraceae bacterium]